MYKFAEPRLERVRDFVGASWFQYFQNRISNGPAAGNALASTFRSQSNVTPKIRLSEGPFKIGQRGCFGDPSFRSQNTPEIGRLGLAACLALRAEGELAIAS